jgi:hypothetical protein
MAVCEEVRSQSAALGSRRLQSVALCCVSQARCGSSVRLVRRDWRIGSALSWGSVITCGPESCLGRDVLDREALVPKLG